MARCKEEGKILYLKKMGQRQLTKENRPQIASHFILTNILERATAICIFFKIYLQWEYLRNIIQMNCPDYTEV